MENLPTSVLGQGVVIVVDLTRDGVEDNVLQNRSEADGVENVRLLFSRETNALGVALFTISKSRYNDPGENVRHPQC